MKQMIMAIILVFFSPMAIAERQLSGEEVISAYAGKTVYGHHAIKEGVSGIGWYAPDGSLKTRRKGEQTVRGKWWVSPKNGSLCLKRQGKKRCRIIFEENGIHKKYKIKKNGERVHKWTNTKFVEGNTEGL